MSKMDFAMHLLCKHLVSAMRESTSVQKDSHVAHDRIAFGIQELLKVIRTEHKPAIAMDSEMPPDLVEKFATEGVLVAVRPLWSTGYKMDGKQKSPLPPFSFSPESN